MEGVKLKDLIAEYVRQGLEASAPASRGARQQRSELSIVRPATGKPVPSFTNAEIDDLFTAEEVERASSG